METGYDGQQVAGMDLHRRRSVLVRMTEDGCWRSSRGSVVWGESILRRQGADNDAG
jgi:hypothetical protein